MKSIAFFVLALAVIAGSWAQYPTTRTQCDEQTCSGCEPFEPPPGAPTDLLCGDDDVFFPVPVQIVTNDQSTNAGLNATQWLCVACCKVNCDFNNAGSLCGWRKYRLDQAPYGCSRCSAGVTLNPTGGTVNTQYVLQSNGNVYKVATENYGGTLIVN